MSVDIKQNIALSNSLELSPTSSSLDLIFPLNAFYYQLSQTTNISNYFSLRLMPEIVVFDRREKKISPRDNILAADYALL